MQSKTGIRTAGRQGRALDAVVRVGEHPHPTVVKEPCAAYTLRNIRVTRRAGRRMRFPGSRQALMTERIGPLKKTILGGVIFLIPFVILLVVAGKAYEMMEKVAAPVASAIGIERIGAIAVINIVTVLALIAACYIAGLLATSNLGKRAHDRIDEKMIDIFPRYSFVKSITAELPEQQAGAMKVVLVSFDDQSQVGFEVERSGAQVVVFLPGSPDPWSGAVSLVAPDRVKPLDVDFKTAVRTIRLAGRGALKIL
jgi:uncharacterized membrane protein